MQVSSRVRETTRNWKHWGVALRRLPSTDVLVKLGSKIEILRKPGFSLSSPKRRLLVWAEPKRQETVRLARKLARSTSLAGVRTGAIYEHNPQKISPPNFYEFVHSGVDAALAAGFGRSSVVIVCLNPSHELGVFFRSLSPFARVLIVLVGTASVRPESLIGVDCVVVGPAVESTVRELGGVPLILPARDFESVEVAIRHYLQIISAKNADLYYSLKRRNTERLPDRLVVAKADVIIVSGGVPDREGPKPTTFNDILRALLPSATDILIHSSWRYQCEELFSRGDAHKIIVHVLANGGTYESVELK